MAKVQFSDSYFATIEYKNMDGLLVKEISRSSKLTKYDRKPK